MKNTRFEALIAAARPETHRIEVDFTDRVMSRIRNPEILSSQIRKKSVNKKETLFMKLRHLPKFAVIAIAIGALLLVSGSAFAAYQLLWPKPHVEVSQPTTSPSGRQQVAISFDQCGDNTTAKHYELKRNATITADQIPAVLKARCELDAIGTWAKQAFPSDERMQTQYKDLSPYDSTMTDIAMATRIKAKDASSITFEGLTKYNQVDKTIDAPATVRYISGGREVKADDIKVGDPVVYVTSELSLMTPQPGCSEQHCSISGAPVSSTLLAVVKLSQPLQDYDQFAWQSLTEIDTCSGNPADSCLTGYAGAVDLYEGNATFTAGSDDQAKEIQGVVTSLDGPSTTIQSSSGTLFTIQTPSDVITTYNTQKAARYYNNQQVKIGSHLIVRYVESADLHNHTIPAKSLSSFQLSIELVGKSDPVEAY